MRARYLVIALAATLLAVGVWLLSRYDTQSEAARPREQASSPAPIALHVAPRIEPEPPTDVERTPTAGASQPPPAPTVAPSTTPAPADLEGTLVLERADGTKDVAPEGRFTLLAWRHDSASPLDVEVHAGHWAARFPDGRGSEVTRVEFQSVRVGESGALVREPAGPLAISSGQLIAVVVYFPISTTLRVVDASAGRDLDDVELLAVDGFSIDEDAYPGLEADEARHALAKHRASPIDFSTLDEIREFGVWTVRVHSPGYAWTMITLDTRAGGERLVRLARGGSLRLTLVDNSGSRGVQLRLRRSTKGGVPVLSTPMSRNGEILLEGLEPGDYSVAAEIGDWFQHPIQLGKVDTTIVAGRETPATLAIEPAPRAELATAGGVVVVPAEWKLERVMVLLKLLDTPLEGREKYFRIEVEHSEPQADGKLAFEWTRGDLQVGRYELGIYKPPASTAIELPRGGRTDFRLELAPPAELAVRVVDDITSDDITIERVVWNPKRPDGVNGGGLESAEFDAVTRRFIIRAPQGEIAVSAWGAEFAHTTDIVTLLPGHQEHTLRLRRASLVEIVLRDGELVLPFQQEWRASVETEDGKPVNMSGTMSVNLRRVGLPSAGRYRFKLPAINGYEPIPDQMVDAIEGKTVRLEVPLTKVR
jgi:hypothetical protein